MFPTIRPSDLRSAARRRSRPAVALMAVLALVLAACSSGGGGLPDDPQEAVVTAFESRAEGGFTADVSVQLSERAREQALAEDPDAEPILDAVTGDGVLTLTTREDQFALSVNLDGGSPIQVRALGDAFYLLVDVPSLLEFADADVDIEELRAQAGQMSMFLGDLSVFVEAALNGSWAGVTGIPEDAGQQISETFGGLAGATPDPEQATEIASELGFTDPGVFADNYLEVQEGSEGRYTAALRLRALVRASAEASAEVSAGGAGEVLSDEELQEIPERVEGITIETEGEQVTALEADIVAIGASAGETTADLEEGDIVVRVEFSDPQTDQLTAPEDAETIEFGAVLETLEGLASMIEGFMGGLTPPGPDGDGPGPGAPSDLPTDLPTDFPTEFGTELPSELQSELQQQS